MKYILAILKNESNDDHIGWINACDQYPKEIDYTVIDLTAFDWFHEINKLEFDYYLTRPPGKTSLFKQLYDERIYILTEVLKKSIYPTRDEILIYENKRMLAYWLQANNIPHPKTNIFYNYDEVLKFAESASFPLVAKSNIGAGGSGVKIYNERKPLIEYIESVFSGRGHQRKWGPNLRKGDYTSRIINRLKNPSETLRYFRQKKDTVQEDIQKGFVILQEYIPCEFEWRVVKIGDSYFAHKKLKSLGQMFSGTSEVSWDAPSEDLLNFVKMVCDKGGFLSQALDIFEPKPGKFYVNELQAFFGSKNPHQMIINGKPGRYRPISGEWRFEEGNFNTNNSYDLRLQNVLELLKKGK